ncbi:hypothetical protein SHD_0103 [Shewanella decolorationis S12]|uniref:Uncharacterized protein n=1 Tax=Shewanella decolorationis S12 TaxID=1353536 RepID=A0ABP2ZEF6_9GAMM|nr:hypothetical protein SHD_0103 [Shewanella decolorationis S12]
MFNFEFGYVIYVKKINPVCNNTEGALKEITKI